MQNKSRQSFTISKISASESIEQTDFLAIEEPLEIKLVFGKDTERQEKSISITMRTPGNDFELAVGFLYTEGIINSRDQIVKIEYATHWNPQTKGNIILVELIEDLTLDMKRLERHFYTSSSCGVCGKASIDALEMVRMPKLPQNAPIFESALIHDLPNRLYKKQDVFKSTGGLHAAALFNTKGEILVLCEDVGRHNAVDKLIGTALLENIMPLDQYLILVSGRASFELIQKTLMAGIPILAAVGAPSSLAVQLAKEANLTVLGFVRDQRFNIYHGKERISVG